MKMAKFGFGMLTQPKFGCMYVYGIDVEVKV